MTWNLLKKGLFVFDAESIHDLSKVILKSPRFFRSWNQSHPIESAHWRRVGLAAGFDKNAEILESLPFFGFGFAEIGTVTPRPQSGNPRPRLFREPQSSSLLNFMGFNNGGGEMVARNLERSRPHLPRNFQVGVNIGKNKDTTPEQTPHDYAQVLSFFNGLADFVVINISSPNTPGLRSFQTREMIHRILSAVHSELDRWGKKPPVFIKWAPEVHFQELIPSIEIDWSPERLEGHVLTNTLSDVVRGGWSGGRLKEASRHSLEVVRSLTRRSLISVGGIDSAAEARQRFDAGADRIEIYTGWVYGGPLFPRTLWK